MYLSSSPKRIEQLLFAGLLLIVLTWGTTCLTEGISKWQLDLAGELAIKSEVCRDQFGHRCYRDRSPDRLYLKDL